jgi:hypothetical protein
MEAVVKCMITVVPWQVPLYSPLMASQASRLAGLEHVNVRALEDLAGEV